jgi:transcriptional regulator GlxA family with amidase domain
VTTTAGLLQPPSGDGLEALESADTIVVPSLRSGAVLTDGTLGPDVAKALIAATGHARVMSICTGAFVLAAAGLLDDRPAATHWGYTGSFRRLFPRVRLDPDVLFVDDGELLTSAGGGAGIDLCLHVVRRDHGSKVANRAARACVVAPWREGGQSQFIERPVPQASTASTGPTRAWALERLDQPLDLAAMARHARMSVRTFTRRFRGETGVSPAQWLIQRRIERAEYLLENTDLPVDRVAADAGFGTAAALRVRLHAAIGVSPSTYRRTFRPSEGPAADSR